MAALICRQHSRRVNTAPVQGRWGEVTKSRCEDVISRELHGPVDHGVNKVNDVLMRLVAGDVKRLSPKSLGEQGLRNITVHRSVHRVLAELRLDLMVSSAAHRPDRTAYYRAQNATFDN